MQEAYRPPCSDYSFCCPILADPPPVGLTPPSWTWPPPPHQLDLTPPWLDLTPPAGWTWNPPPPGWTEDWPPPPPGWTEDWPPPPLWTDRIMDGWMDGQTRVKTLPSRRTTYAGGNDDDKAALHDNGFQSLKSNGVIKKVVVSGRIGYYWPKRSHTLSYP